MNHLKRNILTVFCLTAGLMIMAQSSKVTNAKFSYDAALEKIMAEDFAAAAEELAEAIQEIEPAIAHEKTGMKEKTWRYRANIYELVSRHLDKPEIAAVSENPVSLAAESYQKAMELDSKGNYEMEHKQGLAVMQNLAMNTGINRYNANDYAGAFQMFEQSMLLSESMGITDTLAIYNAALSADRADDDANALKYYQRSLEAGFDEPAIFKFMSEIHLAAGDTAAAEQAIYDGVEAYPSDQGLLIDMVNIYLGKGEMDKALDYLNRTLAQDPENHELQYNVGAVLDNTGNKEEARAAYKKAIELEPSYFDANYNLGASYFNEAVEMINDANAIPTHKVKEYQAAKAKADDVMTKALPYLEKAHELSPEDRSTMVSLAEIYARTNQLEKRKAIMAKMGD
ncbi:MAG: tetratricopeptide repeat protein [Flavobacteriales bacterium]|nr:tetratricopeptide repeat protein [Flavobacteriales bacterium]